MGVTEAAIISYIVGTLTGLILYGMNVRARVKYVAEREAAKMADRLNKQIQSSHEAGFLQGSYATSVVALGIMDKARSESNIDIPDLRKAMEDIKGQVEQGIEDLIRGAHQNHKKA